MRTLLLIVSIVSAFEAPVQARSLFGYDLQLHTRGIVVDGQEFVAVPAAEAEVLLDLLERRGPALVESATTASAAISNLDLQLKAQVEVNRLQGLELTEQKARGDAWEHAARDAHASAGGIMSSPGFWYVIGIASGAALVLLGVGAVAIGK